MSLKLAQYLMATLAANWATYGGWSEMQSDAATDTLAHYTMFGAILQRHRRIIKMFYDCRHKEATQRKREGKTEKERWRAEQNKDSATEHKASFIMSSCWERRKTKKRNERRRNWSKRGRLDAVDALESTSHSYSQSTATSTSTFNFHSCCIKLNGPRRRRCLDMSVNTHE